jgi:D-alanine-D-alanine ligase
MKKKVGVLYGGKSGEHEVSRCSAASVFSSIDRSLYDVIAIGVDRDGRWYPQEPASFAADPAFGKVLDLKKEGSWLVNNYSSDNRLVLHETGSGRTVEIDVVFPIIHGTNGEDGTLQGLLDLASVPYVGPGVLGSSAGMDKDCTKRLLLDQGISVVPWITVTRIRWQDARNEIMAQIDSEIGYPFFVKPANAGSSVGIHKVKQRAEAAEKIADSLRYDTKVLIEKSVDCREIECAVLGNNDSPRASILGEVIPSHEFYSYEAKYIDADGAKLVIPAQLEGDCADRIRSDAVKGFRALYLDGLARMDFFVEKGTGRYYLNEVNTLPGFTSISMYPKLWEHTGLPYGELLSELLRLALVRHSERKNIETKFLR